MKLKAIASLLLMLAVSSSTYSELSREQQEDILHKFERFKLFNHCQPVYLLIDDLSPEAEDISLNKEDIQNAVESRLRSAGLYLDEIDLDKSYLFVKIYVFKISAVLIFEFNKEVVDKASGVKTNAPTWDNTMSGYHGGDSGYISSAIAKQTDKFLVEYLRVNEGACGN